MSRPIHMEAGDAPRLVGFIPAWVEIPCTTGAWSVELSYLTFRHICERRENERPEHLALVLSRMGTVISAPTHAGCLTSEPHKLDLFAWTEGDMAGVLVSLKCLHGETWVNTAFPLGRKSLRKHIAAGRLVPVVIPAG